MTEPRYQVIYADPPWDYDDKSQNRGGAARHYGTTDLATLKRLDVASLAADEAALFMWGTWPQLSEAQQLMAAWGFEYSTCAFVWVKRSKHAWANAARELRGALWQALTEWKLRALRQVLTGERLAELLATRWHWGMGQTTRSNTEFVLVGFRGRRLARLDKGVHQVIDAPVGEHSAKPEEVRRRIERLYGDVPRLELFARRPAPGWDLFGNEAPDPIHIPLQPEEAAA